MRELSTLLGMQVKSAKGENMGKVKDILYDDREWTSRYLVVDTGGLFKRNEILISPIVVSDIHSDDGITLRMHHEEIEDSPKLESRLPISRQMEKTYVSYFGWPTYWVTPLSVEGVPPISRPEHGKGWRDPAQPEKSSIQISEQREKKARSSGQIEANLRSFNELLGYEVSSLDEGFGKVDDILQEEDSWKIRYFSIKTRKWLPSKSVLLAIEWVDQISWTHESIQVSLPSKQIKDSPSYTSASKLTRSQEKALYRHYGREGYWTREEVKKAS